MLEFMCDECSKVILPPVYTLGVWFGGDHNGHNDHFHATCLHTYVMREFNSQRQA